MIQAMVTPQYVNSPREAHHKNGSIKDQAGTYYSVPADKLSLFQQGVAANITYEQRQGQRGSYNVVTGVNGQAFNGANGSAPQQQATQQQPQQQRSNDQAVQIFVTGVIGRCFHGTGTIPDSDTLAAMVASCRRAFINGMGDETKDAPF